MLWIGWISIQVFLLRQSTIIKREAAMFPIYDQIEDEVLYHLSFSFKKTKTIFFQRNLWFQAIDPLSETLGVKVMTPNVALRTNVRPATQNSEISLNENCEEKSKVSWRQKVPWRTLRSIRLEKVSVIESFDYSNIQGTNEYSRCRSLWWKTRQKTTASLKWRLLSEVI